MTGNDRTTLPARPLPLWPEGPMFRDIPGFPGYGIDTEGRFWSCWTKSRGPGTKGKWNIGDSWRISKCKPDPGNGYIRVTMRANGRIRRVDLHRLVLEVFVGPAPVGYQACHSPDPNRTNNRLSNLRWDRPIANVMDMYRHGTLRTGENHPNAKLTAEKVREMRRLAAEGHTGKSLAPRYGLNYNTINRIIARKSWVHVD